MKTIEIEMRGPLSIEQKDSAYKFLSENGTFKQKKERVLIDYSTFLEGEGVEDREKDIRARHTNGVSEIIIKTGSWGGSDGRREYSIKSECSFDDMVQSYHLLGYSKGVLCIRNSDIFDYKGVEVALVEVPGHSYFFEAEVEVSDESKMNKGRELVQSIVDELGLAVSSDEEYFAYIEVLNKEANEVFDANVETETYFKDRFGI